MIRVILADGADHPKVTDPKYDQPQGVRFWAKFGLKLSHKFSSSSIKRKRELERSRQKIDISFHNEDFHFTLEIPNGHAWQMEFYNAIEQKKVGLGDWNWSSVWGISGIPFSAIPGITQQPAKTLSW